jgi:hypothetical protein
MARFINANRNNDIIDKLIIERLNKNYIYAKNYLKNVDPFQINNDEKNSFCLFAGIDINELKAQESKHINLKKRFIDTVGLDKKESYIEIQENFIKRKIKNCETISLIIALISIIISQTEYELEYFPKHYLNSSDDIYTGSSPYIGDYIRITLCLFSFLLIFLSYVNCGLAFDLHKEKEHIYHSNIYF